MPLIILGVIFVVCLVIGALKGSGNRRASSVGSILHTIYYIVGFAFLAFLVLGILGSTGLF